MNNLELKSEKKDDIMFLSIAGDINADNIRTFRIFIEQEFPTFKNNALFNLSGLSYINSMGIGTLIKSIKEIQKNKHKACLVGLNENIAQILRITGLIAILEVFKTQEEGLNYLKDH